VFVVAGILAFPAAAQAPAPPETSKACHAAQSKLARERDSLAAARAQLAKDTKAREGCSTKTSCARFDSAMATQTKRIARHEVRAKKFEATQEQACAVK
jgi:hypothetical protein